MTACASRCSSACLLRQIIIVKKMRGTGVAPLDKSGHISVLRSYQQEQPRPPIHTRPFPRCGAASMDTHELYSIEEARFMLGGISRASIYELLNNSELPSVVICRRRFVPVQIPLELEPSTARPGRRRGALAR